MRKPYLMSCGLAALVACAVAHAQQAPVKLNIESQPLDRALNSWAEQTGYQVLIPVERAARGRTAPSVKGSYTPEGALKILLASSDLGYQFVNSRTVTIQMAAADAGAPQRRTEASQSAAAQTGNDRPLALAQSRPREQAAAVSDQSNGVPLSQNTSNEPTQEVIVTAQKRFERLLEVPVPVTAINASSLVDSNQLRLQDYYTRIPALSVTLGGDGGTPQLTIRGLTTGGFTNPTVGIVVDDVPYGSSTSQGSGFLVPDVDPSDLAHVEVLRGPQGTLYGASNMGGLLKYVTVDPSMAGFSGRVQAGLNSVYHGDEAGYSARGAVNVPLSQNFALRASGFTRRDPGYIDDPVLGEKGVNWGETYGGRVSTLWKPSDRFSLKLSALLQDNKVHGSSETYLLPGLSDLEQQALQNTGGHDRKSQAYNATLTAELGKAELTAVSGYTKNDVVTDLDLTPTIYGGATQFVFGVNGTTDFVHHETDKFTQEIRIAVPLGSRVEWLFGGFYTDEDTSQVQSVMAQDPSGSILGLAFGDNSPYTFKEHALFTDFTFQLTDRFDIQLGARESWNKQTLQTTYTGPFVPLVFGVASPRVVPEVRSKDNAFTYLVTPRLRLSPDVMLYARLASGYRPGGPNSNAALIGVHPEYDADTTQNYEIGIKGEVLDDSLIFDASLYYIDWKDIQLQLFDPSFNVAYFANAGKAKSQGVELSVESRPITGFRISGWVAWNDAELTEGFPATAPAVGVKGDRLPYGSRFSGNVSLDKETSFANGMRADWGGALSYVGKRMGLFQNFTPQRETYPAYAQVDLWAGLRWSGSWAFNLYANNVTDRRGILRGGRDGPNGLVVPSVNYIQPRTVGVSLSKTFE